MNESQKHVAFLKSQLHLYEVQNKAKQRSYLVGWLQNAVVKFTATAVTFNSLFEPHYSLSPMLGGKLPIEGQNIASSGI